MRAGAEVVLLVTTLSGGVSELGMSWLCCSPQSVRVSGFRSGGPALP